MDDPQREIVAFLGDPASYPPGIAAIEIIETHASIVFLAGTRAYKLKRAVKYAYLDFSSPALRLAACTRELRLNRRTAPQLYLEVCAICRGANGAVIWGRPEGAAEPIDYVVVMRRFDARDLLENLAQTGGLSAALCYALVAHIAEFHRDVEARPGRGGTAAMAALATTNIAILRGCRAAGFAAAQIDRLESRLRGELAAQQSLLDERAQGGRVRLCHGDLHLRNICLVDGQPVLFDCVEFSEELATIDVLYDLAFLLMDLGHRRYPALANLVLNRYLDLTGEDDGLSLMPLFMALRAMIRAHVTATMAEHGWGSGGPAAAVADARRYLDEAAAALVVQPARLVAVGGLSGAGKSVLAAALAAELGGPPGARVLRSDVLRKLRFGAAPESRLPAQAYTAEINRRVYGDLCTRAAAALRAGFSAVIDAVALRPEERAQFAAVAAAAGVPFTGLWLEAPPATMRTRLDARHGDASDASEEVLDAQLARSAGALDWVRLDAGGGAAATLAAARRAMRH